MKPSEDLKIPVFNDDPKLLNDGIWHLKEAIHHIEKLDTRFKTAPENENIRLILEKLDLNQSVFGDFKDMEKFNKSI